MYIKQCGIVFLNIAMLSLYVFGSNEDSFISKYDAKEYKAAAVLINEVDRTNAEVARRLGAMYFSGLGVPQDSTLGKYLTICAAKSGNVDASENLVKMFVQENDYLMAVASLAFLEKQPGISLDEITKFKKKITDGAKILNGIDLWLQERNEDKKAIETLTESRKKDQELASAKEKSLIDNNEKEIKKYTKQIEELQKSTSEQIKKLDQLVAEQSEKFTQDIAQMKQKYSKEITQLKQNVEAKEKENSNLKVKLSDVENDLKNKTEKFAKLKVEIKERNSRLQDLEEEVKSIANKKTELEQQNKECEKKIKLFSLLNTFIDEEYNALIRNNADAYTVAEKVNRFFKEKYNPLHKKIYGEADNKKQSGFWNSINPFSD